MVVADSDVLIDALDAGREPMAAAVARYLGRTGQRIPAPDLLIAGVCLATGLPHLTRNATHFRRIPGLVLAPPPA